MSNLFQALGNVWRAVEKDFPIRHTVQTATSNDSNSSNLQDSIINSNFEDKNSQYDLAEEEPDLPSFLAKRILKNNN